MGCHGDYTVNATKPSQSKIAFMNCNRYFLLKTFVSKKRLECKEIFFVVSYFPKCCQQQGKRDWKNMIILFICRLVLSSCVICIYAPCCMVNFQFYGCFKFCWYQGRYNMNSSCLSKSWGMILFTSTGMSRKFRKIVEKCEL